MGYIGLSPTAAQQNYLTIDDISSSFDGSTTSFALQVGGVAPSPFPVTNSCLISVGGVIQNPDDSGTEGFRISGTNIVFSSAPGIGQDFFGVVLAGADYLNVGANFPAGTVGNPSITFDGDLDTGFYRPSPNELGLVSGGTEAARIDSNRRLGIGVTVPTTVVHAEAAQAELQLKSTSGTNSAGVRFVPGGQTNAWYIYADGSRNLIFDDHASERARIDSAGRLLVGTSTANSNFKYGGSGDSATTTQIDGASSSRDVGLAIVNHNSSDTQPVLRLAKSRGTAASPTAVSNDDYTGSIQFMGYDGTRYIDTARIDSLVNGNPGTNDMPGELIFSTTVSGSSVVTPRMRLSNDAVGYVANLYGTTAWIAATSSGSSGTVVIFACRRSATAVDNGTNVFFVYANGSYGTVSDVNQKKNIETTRDGYLEDLNRLRVVKYNWNDQEDTEPRELGLIAQEVEEVFPGLVSETQTEGEDPVKGIKYSVLPVMLLKALQEADAKIEAQATQIASQAATIAAIEARLTALEGGAS